MCARKHMIVHNVVFSLRVIAERAVPDSIEVAGGPARSSLRLVPWIHRRGRSLHKPPELILSSCPECAAGAPSFSFAVSGHKCVCYCRRAAPTPSPCIASGCVPTQGHAFSSPRVIISLVYRPLICVSCMLHLVPGSSRLRSSI